MIAGADRGEHSRAQQRSCFVRAQRVGTYAQTGQEMVCAASWIGDDPTVGERHCRRDPPPNLPDQYRGSKPAIAAEIGEGAQVGFVRLGREVDVVCVRSKHDALLEVL